MTVKCRGNHAPLLRPLSITTGERVQAQHNESDMLNLLAAASADVGCMKSEGKLSFEGPHCLSGKIILRFIEHDIHNHRMELVQFLLSFDLCRHSATPPKQKS